MLDKCTIPAGKTGVLLRNMADESLLVIFHFNFGFVKAFTSNYVKLRCMGIETPQNSLLRFSYNEIAPENLIPCYPPLDRAKN